MTLQPQARTTLACASFILALTVIAGAFGAHGLKSVLSPEKLVTYETGIRYQFYHAFGIFLVGILQQVLPNLRLGPAVSAFAAGIILFSGNCYFYTLTGIKVFAMIVPLGGMLFIAGWTYLFYRIIKS